jgi:hypothetical protein
MQSSPPNAVRMPSSRIRPQPMPIRSESAGVRQVGAPLHVEGARNFRILRSSRLLATRLSQRVEGKSEAPWRSGDGECHSRPWGRRRVRAWCSRRRPGHDARLVDCCVPNAARSACTVLWRQGSHVRRLGAGSSRWRARPLSKVPPPRVASIMARLLFRNLCPAVATTQRTGLARTLAIQRRCQRGDSRECPLPPLPDGVRRCPWWVFGVPNHA